MDGWCKGCTYHEFPYEAQVPIMIDGKYQIKSFYSNEDVHEIVKLIIKETEELNKQQGGGLDIATSVSKQLPFFSCMNALFDPNSKKDIEKYIYCKDLGISPYKGSYGEQPKKWVDKMFLIKNALARKEAQVMKEAKNG